MIDFQKLAAPFPPSQVSWRVGMVRGDRGLALAYLDARDVMDRLDSVCGPHAWQCRYSHVGAITVCDIGVFDGKDWVFKADGAGQSDIEAEKGALSDAFKRAAVRWGIGRYLYHLPSPWVDIEKRGNTAIISKNAYKELEALLADVSPKQAGTAPSHASVSSRPTLPPADPDVVAGAKRWVNQQAEHLAACQIDTDVFEWEDQQQKALTKLKLQHIELYADLMKAKSDALDRIKATRYPSLVTKPL